MKLYLIPTLTSLILLGTSPCVAAQDDLLESSNKNEVIQENGLTYVKDLHPGGHTWSPIGPKAMSWAEAKIYCENLKGLDQTWTLPTEEDFRTAFNPNNPSQGAMAYNRALTLVFFDMNKAFFWSSTPDPQQQHSAKGFFGSSSQMGSDYQGLPNSVRCVNKL